MSINKHQMAVFNHKKYIRLNHLLPHIYIFFSD